jgi:hypothetical protein
LLARGEKLLTLQVLLGLTKRGSPGVSSLVDLPAWEIIVKEVPSNVQSLVHSLFLDIAIVDFNLR